MSDVDQGLFGLSDAAVGRGPNGMKCSLLTAVFPRGLMQKEEWDNIGLGEVALAGKDATGRIQIEKNTVTSVAPS